MTLSFLEIALAIVVSAAGSLIQASVGYGIGLVLVPLLALIDPAFVPGPVLAASLLLAAVMAVRGRRAADHGNIGFAIGGMFVGTFAAAFILTIVNRDMLPTLFAVLILLAVGASASGLKVPVSRPNLIAAGIGAGLMGTMGGIHGPPIALLYQHHVGTQVRATLGIFFVTAYAIAVASLAFVDLYGPREIELSLVLMPGIVLGYVLSPLLARFLDRGYLRPAILAVAALSALVLLIYG